MNIPTYQDVIEEASFWRRTNDLADLRKAEAILRAGMGAHPYALPIGDELVLVLEKQGRDDEALALLRRLMQQHQNGGEETLARFGRIFKKRGEKQLAEGAFAMAESSFLESEQHYHRAFEKSRGIFPRINELSVRFLRASIRAYLEKQPGYEGNRGEHTSAELLQSVLSDANKMLNDPNFWGERKTDDHIWLPATRAEACFLLGEWENSTTGYRDAIEKAQGAKFYHDCMAGQVKLLLAACARMGITVPTPLNNPETFFA